MESQRIGQNTLERLSGLVSSARAEYLAHWVSLIGSPPLTATAAAGLSAGLLATPTAWLWTAIYSILAVLVPLLYVVWLFHTGQVTDLDLRIREQRTRPLLVTLAAAITALVVLYLGAAPRLLVALAGANTMQTAIFLGITRRWKISAHSAAAATLATLGWLLIGNQAQTLALTIGVPVIAWSRIRLHHHTPAQTIAGAALGSSLVLAALLLYGA
jgi:membrane-associated phospholipid phosphatase